MLLRHKLIKLIFGKDMLECVLGDRRLYLHDPVTAIIVGSLIAGGATAGTSAYQAHEEKKSQKNLLEYQEEQARKAESKIAGAEALATQEATEKIKKRRLSRTQTILTSPLGLSDEANVSSRTLLGG